jgi:hypothetical protein
MDGVDIAAIIIYVPMTLITLAVEYYIHYQGKTAIAMYVSKVLRSVDIAFIHHGIPNPDFKVGDRGRINWDVRGSVTVGTNCGSEE